MTDITSPMPNEEGNSVSPVATAPPAGLTGDNADHYWKGAWKHNETGWKAFEKNHAVFQNNVKAVEDALNAHRQTPPNGGDVANSSSSPTSSVANIFAQQQGAFVPLCGDTHAVRFLVNGLLGCNEESGVAPKQVKSKPSENPTHYHFVMGVDLAPASIEANMKTNFPEFNFDVLQHKHNGVTAHFTHYFARAVNPNRVSRCGLLGMSAADEEAQKVQQQQQAPCVGEGGGAELLSMDGDEVPFVDIHFFAGDYFEVCTWWAAQAEAEALMPNSPIASPISYKFFDFVYDRASMVAMHPTLRLAYVNALVRLLGVPLVTPTAAAVEAGVVPTKAGRPPIRVFLELCHRPEKAREAGPPFHIDPDAVALSETAAAAEDADAASTVHPGTFYPSCFKRLQLAYQEEMPPNGPPFKFVKHVLFVENQKEHRQK